MNAGRLKERITLMRFVQEKSGTNQKRKGSYVPAFTVWAEVLCTQSAVRDDDGVIVYETVYRINVRKRPDIRADMHVQWRGREFYLTGEPVDWTQEMFGMTLLAKEIS